jgi:hypothetical protein
LHGAESRKPSDGHEIFSSVPRLPACSFLRLICGGVLPPLHSPDKPGAAASPIDKSWNAQRPPTRTSLRPELWPRDSSRATSHSSKDLMPLPDIVNYLILSVLTEKGEGHTLSIVALSHLISAKARKTRKKRFCLLSPEAV